MDNSWENFEPAPMEYFHSEAMRLFHEFRCERSGAHNVYISVTGSDINTILAKAKTATYLKYPKLNLDKAIPKSKM